MTSPFATTKKLGAEGAERLVPAIRGCVEESLAEWDYSPEKPERLAGYRPEEILRDRIARFIGWVAKRPPGFRSRVPGPRRAR